MATESKADRTDEQAGIMARAPTRPPATSSRTSTTVWQRLREGLPLLMSVLAFAVSLTSLYMVTLRSGNVTAMTGPVMALSHDPITGAARVSLAVNLANTGARLITVAGVQLRITTPDQKIVIPFTALTRQVLDDKGEPRDSSLLAPITLAARSESTYQLGFVSSDTEHALLQPGRYQVELQLKTTAGAATQHAEQWQLDISEQDAMQLQHWYQLNIGNSVMVAKP